ncbi:SMI1/KNR4 family protein [Gemmata sp.]|uniref:SMI1/KNR4 family protein n=1 Tax=Gemmata sp. TaxID=1914242 RepID=UPI003F70F444
MRELEPHVYVYGPASEDVIRELEAAFGRPMPPSYRAFLTRFGGFSILDSTYSGIIDGKIAQGRSWAWTDTKYARGWCQLPEHYLVVQPDEDGFKCLDFSRTDTAGEHPVIYHMPFRKTPFNEMATSYGAWLLDDLRAMVDAWAEDAEPDNAPDPAG